jgi:dienelactone hydrolase
MRVHRHTLLSACVAVLPAMAAAGPLAAQLPAAGDDAVDRLDASPRHGEWIRYDAGSHGFLRNQQGQDGADLCAAEQAWPLTISFFREHLGA